MLHYLDNLDSKMESMRAHFEREATSESPWTGYNSSLSRPLLNSAKFLEKKPPRPSAPEPAATETQPIEAVAENQELRTEN
jgi:3'-5' exoribonuclease